MTKYQSKKKIFRMAKELNLSIHEDSGPHIIFEIPELEDIFGNKTYLKAVFGETYAIFEIFTCGKSISSRDVVGPNGFDIVWKRGLKKGYIQREFPSSWEETNFLSDNSDNEYFAFEIPMRKFQYTPSHVRYPKYLLNQENIFDYVRTIKLAVPCDRRFSDFLLLNMDFAARILVPKDALNWKLCTHKHIEYTEDCLDFVY